MRVDLDGNPIDSSIDSIEVNDTLSLVKGENDGEVVIDFGDYTYHIDKVEMDDLSLALGLAFKYGWFNTGLEGV
jgi:hypothetical protein